MCSGAVVPQGSIDNVEAVVSVGADTIVEVSSIDIVAVAVSVGAKVVKVSGEDLAVDGSIVFAVVT